MPVYGPDDAFDQYPHLGWEVGPTESEKVQFIFARKDKMPIDWQGGKDISGDRIPGGPRTLYQDMGAKPLTLTTTLIFADKAKFHKFRRLSDRPGLLRMNANHTIWPGRAPGSTRKDGRDYAEFEDVIVTVIPDEAIPSLDGMVFCEVTFVREDTTWS